MSTNTPSKSSEYMQLEKALRVRYPPSTDLSVNDFMRVESVLAVAREVSNGNVCASKAYLVLCNYALIRPQAFANHEHLQQMARRQLLALSSKSNWKRLLDLYMSEEYYDLRSYDIEDDVVVLRTEPYGGFNREQIYLQKLLERTKANAKDAKAKEGYTYSYSFRPENTSKDKRPDYRKTRSITIPELNLPQREGSNVVGIKNGRDPIVLAIDELVDVADDISNKTGRRHYATVMRRIRTDGLLKDVSGKAGIACDQVTLRQVTGLVGLVGSGKSVFTMILMVALAQRGLKVVSLLNSVADVMDTVSILRQVGVTASPLVSTGNRIAHLSELFDQGGSMLLHDTVARYLETPCIIDGMSPGEPEACSYADIPCHALRDSKGRSLSCPYWEVCPSAAMSREAMTSDVVVTTPSGYATMRVGENRIPFFEHVIHHADLVIFDEADRIQAQLDSTFAPQMSFMKLIRHAADPTAQAMKRDPSEKTADRDVERFYDYRMQTDLVAKSLLFSVNKKEVSAWKIVRKKAFTSLTLINSLRDDMGLSEKVVTALEDRVNGSTDNFALDVAISTSCLGTDDQTHQHALSAFLKGMREELSATLYERLSFTIKVIRFDEFLRELADSSDFLSYHDESVSELYTFLRFSHTAQQRYLPSSPIGNLFGMRFTDDNDLILFRQFAFGRAFMNSLPWLETDDDGSPMGPHALLLSGSYYLPGCLQYHINHPADYLLEAEAWKSQKIAESTVKDLGLEQHVSGSARQARQANLNTVLTNLMDTLTKELDEPTTGKILVVVNSYAEGATALATLERELRRCGRTETACCMTKSVDEDRERYIPRSEVYRFATHPARILIAPALAIERGYNIVDETGHAVFTTVIFSVRPMGLPSDLSLRFKRMNGFVESQVTAYPTNAHDFVTKVRGSAWKQWKILERDERIAPSLWRSMGKELVLIDTVSTLLETIDQIFGRLLRLSDPNRPSPHLYFADAAFRGSSDEEGKGFRTLDELRQYLQWIISESDQPAVARALYGPFFEAFTRGIA